MKILKKITLAVCLIFALTAVAACKESPLQSVSEGEEDLSQSSSQESSLESDTPMSSDGLYEDEESSSEEDSTFTSDNRHEIVLSEVDWDG